MKRTFSGINIQFPISQLILNGEKTVETRTYPLPSAFMGRDLLFIETPGKSGKFKSRIVAIIRFEKCFKYQSEREFYSDIHRHKVTKDSPWAWNIKGKWGWVIASLKTFDKPKSLNRRIGIRYTSNIDF